MTIHNCQTINYQLFIINCLPMVLMRVSRISLAAACCIIAFVLPLGPCWAFKPKIGVIASTVTVNGRQAISFRTSNGKNSAAKRAAIACDRLKALVDHGARPESLYVKSAKRSARIYWAESLICVASSRDAKKARSTAASLAQDWVSRTRTLLAMPPIILSERELTIPLGEDRRVDVGGAATGPIYAASQKSAVATVEVKHRHIEISGNQVGQSLVDVTVEGESASLPVFVKKYAGGMARPPVAQVTGDPCSYSVLDYAARQATLRNVMLEPGAHVEIESVEHIKAPLVHGQKRTVTANVRITGEGYIPYLARIPVQVCSIAMPHREPMELFYSNDPEQITKYQPLFAGELRPDESTRILYHHQNMMGKHARLLIDLINPESAPASFRVFKGVAGPMVDTVEVGHEAGSEFVWNFLHNAGVMENLPPHSRLVLVSEVLGHLETASGVLQIDQTKGRNAWIRIMALQPGQDNVSVGDILPAPDPLLLQPSDEIYPSPRATLEAEYVVGQRWAFIPIGKHGISGYTAKNQLDGNYGVTYNIDVSVQNPGRDAKTITISFEPTAGRASGVFIVDGKLVMVRQIQPPSDANLVSFRLRAGGVKKIRIVTMPLAGSSYPAQLVVKS